jgi:hypothetical protein
VLALTIPSADNGVCFNHRELFPADKQWGLYDTREVCNMTHIIRSFFASTNARPARAVSARSSRSAVAIGAAALAIMTLAATLGLRDRGLPGSRTGGLFNAGVWDGGSGGAVELSQRMRGHDLSSDATHAHAHHAHGHVPVSPHAPHTPMAHARTAGPGASGAKVTPPAPPPPLTAAQKAKIERENELWKTEQAMKAKLDESDKAKGNRLWQQTISVVHKHDPNAALIAKLNKENMLTVFWVVT